MRVSSTKSRYYQSWSRWRYCDFCHMVGAKTPLLQPDHTLADYIKAPIMKLVLSDYQSKQLSALSGSQFPWFNCLSTKISNFDRSDDYLRAAVLTNSVPLTASILFISLCWFTYIGALLGDQINCMIKNFHRPLFSCWTHSGSDCPYGCECSLSGKYSWGFHPSSSKHMRPI